MAVEQPSERPGARASQIRGEIVIPYVGYTIALDSVAAARWRWLLEAKECGSPRERIVFINGLRRLLYIRQDYFLALGDNSADQLRQSVLRFIPYRNLIGRAWSCLLVAQCRAAVSDGRGSGEGGLGREDAPVKT